MAILSNGKERRPEGLTRESLLRILEVTQKLAASTDLMALLVEMVEAGKEVLLAGRGSLWIYHAESHELEMRVPLDGRSLRIPVGQGLAGQCLETGRIINVPDAYADPRFSASIDHTTGYHTRSILSIPLLGRFGEPVGVMQLLNKQGGAFDDSDEMVATALAAQCAVAVQRSQLTAALMLKERLDEEVSLARKVQMGTLPDRMPELPGYDLHGMFLPADQTGGDMFDLVVLDGRLFILLGDAAGHGIGAALSATQMQAMLRVAFRCGADLAQAYRHVNNQLAEDLPDDRFITAFVGFLDPATHTVEFYSGGQGPLLHFHAADQSCEWLQPSHLPLGILQLYDQGPPRRLGLEPGDVLALLSDGIYESTSDQGVQFGEERVRQVMARHHHLPMAELGQQLVQSVVEFACGEKQADDITAVLVRRLPQD